MSKSDDNTNELESYGVWVKNSTGESDTSETLADTSDELNLDDGGIPGVQAIRFVHQRPRPVINIGEAQRIRGSDRLRRRNG